MGPIFLKVKAVNNKQNHLTQKHLHFIVISYKISETEKTKPPTT
jgi:hypothetical protein